MIVLDQYGSAGPVLKFVDVNCSLIGILLHGGTDSAVFLICPLRQDKILVLA